MIFVGKGRYVSKTVDIWGSDLIARHPQRSIMFVQVTSDFHKTRKRELLASEYWNFDTTDVMYIRYRVLKHEINEFLISELTEHGWEDTVHVPATIPRFFVPVDDYVKRKSGVSIEKVCDYLGWDKKEFMLRRKARKNKTKELEI